MLELCSVAPEPSTLLGPLGGWGLISHRTHDKHVIALSVCLWGEYVDWMHRRGHLWMQAISLSWGHTRFLRAMLPCSPSNPRSASAPLLPGKLEFTFLSLRDTVFGTRINSPMKHIHFSLLIELTWNVNCIYGNIKVWIHKSVSFCKTGQQSLNLEIRLAVTWRFLKKKLN